MVPKKEPKKTYISEFKCQAPLKFYEKCSKCPRYEGCYDLKLAFEVLKGKKKVSYNPETKGENTIDATDFTCTTPLHYIERTRMKCAKQGKCREEGLLVALLSGKRTIDYLCRD